MGFAHSIQNVKHFFADEFWTALWERMNTNEWLELMFGWYCGLLIYVSRLWKDEPPVITALDYLEHKIRNGGDVPITIDTVNKRSSNIVLWIVFSIIRFIPQKPITWLRNPSRAIVHVVSPENSSCWNSCDARSRLVLQVIPKNDKIRTGWVHSPHA